MCDLPLAFGHDTALSARFHIIAYLPSVVHL